MLKTIRSQLLAFSILAATIAAAVGTAGTYAVAQLNQQVTTAVNDGVAMRNHMQTDMLHDNLRGLVEAYKGAVTDNSPQRIKEVEVELKAAASQIRLEYAKNNDAPNFDAALREEVARVAGVIDTYAKSAEQMLAVDPTDLADLEKRRADFSKQFTVLEKDLGAVRDSIEAQLNRSRAAGVEATSSAQVLVFSMMALGTLALVGAAMMLYGRVTDKLTRLTSTLEKLNAGDYAARVQLAGDDELGAVGGALDKLLDDRLEALAAAAKESETLTNSVVEIMQAVGQVATSKDLSIHVPVTADVTGAIGDAMNMLTSETAKVMGKVVDVSGDVSSASLLVQQSSDSAMTAANQGQAEVESAARELSNAAVTLTQLAQMAQKANESAEQSVRTTRQALATVDKTVKGINQSRDLIRETEKRIKRLGERSQEITQVVGLINSIAERTGILALNASMQATAAGDAGRGFAIVADEVKRLSENAREATREISTLVSSIQSETSETVLAMNNAITQVVDVSRLADQAGAEMMGTQQATDELASNVRNIAATSVDQARAGEALQSRARAIQQSSRDTTQQLNAQNEVTSKLVAHAQALVREVSVFKLPRQRNV